MGSTSAAGAWRTGYLDQVRAVIAEHGWLVQSVFPEAGDPGPLFAYTVGLTACGRAELLVAGLEPGTAQALLNDAAGRAEPFTHGQQLTDWIVGYTAVVVEGPHAEPLWPGTARALYGASAVRLQQLVWPDPAGRFPWDDDFEPGLRDAQPTIGKVST